MQLWSEIILVISNRTRAARSFDFVITPMIADQIALHSVQLPLLIFHEESTSALDIDSKVKWKLHDYTGILTETFWSIPLFKKKVVVSLLHVISREANWFKRHCGVPVFCPRVKPRNMSLKDLAKSLYAYFTIVRSPTVVKSAVFLFVWGVEGMYCVKSFIYN